MTRRRAPSSPAAGARPSPRSSPQSPRARHARRHRPAAHTGHQRMQFGREHATAPDGGAARERAAAAEPPAPTSRQERDQHALRTPWQPRSLSARPAAQLILKRSVRSAGRLGWRITSKDTVPDRRKPSARSPALLRLVANGIGGSVKIARTSRRACVPETAPH